MREEFLLLVLLLWLVPQPASAAQSDTLRIAAGERVRVLSFGQEVDGFVHSPDPGIVEFTDVTGELHRLSYADMTRVQLFEGRHRAIAQWAVVGALLGVGVRASGEVILMDGCGETCSVSGPSYFAIAAAFGAIGAMFGMLPRDRWKAIRGPWRVEAARSAGRGRSPQLIGLQREGRFHIGISWR